MGLVRPLRKKSPRPRLRPALRPRELLFRYSPGDLSSTQSFSRSSTATYYSRQTDQLETAESGNLRDTHFVED